MIDVYATAGTFADVHQLARDLAETLMKIEQVPDIPMFRMNTAAFVHELADRDKQRAVVRQFTDLIAAAAGDPSLATRTWVLLTEAVDGGWGLGGNANTNAELVDAACAQIAELAGNET